MDHFLTAGHQEYKFMHTVLYMGMSKGRDLQLELLKMEAYCIHHLGTISPSGMNISLDLSCYLCRSLKEILSLYNKESTRVAK